MSEHKLKQYRRAARLAAKAMKVEFQKQTVLHLYSLPLFKRIDAALSIVFKKMK